MKIHKLPAIESIGTSEKAALRWIEQAIRLRYPITPFTSYRLSMNNETGAVTRALQRLDEVAPVRGELVE
jgi:hypothetical protein